MNFVRCFARGDEISVTNTPPFATITQSIEVYNENTLALRTQRYQNLQRKYPPLSSMTQRPQALCTLWYRCPQCQCLFIYRYHQLQQTKHINTFSSCTYCYSGLSMHNSELDRGKQGEVEHRRLKRLFWFLQSTGSPIVDPVCRWRRLDTRLANLATGEIRQSLPKLMFSVHYTLRSLTRVRFSVLNFLKVTKFLNRTSRNGLQSTVSNAEADIA